MKSEIKVYEKAIIEVIVTNEEDIIRTSPTIELPWLPLEEDGELYT